MTRKLAIPGDHLARRCGVAALTTDPSLGGADVVPERATSEKARMQQVTP